MNRASFIVPLLVFILIVGVFGLGFNLEDRSVLPSPLINQPFPEFSGPDLLDPNGEISRSDIVGRPVLVNVWATWCPTCLAEHEQLMKIAATGTVGIVGVNYKDDTGKAQRWLIDFGNPYDDVVSDPNGALAIELGVYGAPETFLLDANGVVRYKRVGNVTAAVWQEEILPRVRSMLDGAR